MGLTRALKTRQKLWVLLLVGYMEMSPPGVLGVQWRVFWLVRFHMLKVMEVYAGERPLK